MNWVAWIVIGTLGMIFVFHACWLAYELGRRHEREFWQKGLDDMGIKVPKKETPRTQRAW